NLGFLQRTRFRLEILFTHGDTTPSGITEKPKTVRRRLVPSGTQSCFLNGTLKCFLRLARLACHQETESIKLRETLGGNRHNVILYPNLPSVDCGDKSSPVRRLTSAFQDGSLPH